MHAGKSQCMPGSPPRAAARSRQACRQIPVHARRARGAPGAARPATPAEMVAAAPSPLSCSRESRTRRAAFLVVEHYWGQKLVATGSLEQALISSMGGLLISRGQHRQKRGAMQVLPRAALVALMG